MQPVVLVVGAGPVGLTVANKLARFGVPVRIIDSRAEPQHLSKALVLWRRSLHTLDPIIPWQHWLDDFTGSRQVAGVSLADNGAIFAAVDMDRAPTTEADCCAAAAPDAPPARRQHMLPPGVLITQTQVEAGLEQHLQDKYGISVQRSTALDTFTAEDQGVRCVLRTVVQQPAHATSGSGGGSSAQQTGGHHKEEEEEEVLTVSYLIGCDGAHSTVRKGLLGVSFPGYSDPSNRFQMMDCTYEYQPGINSNSPGSSEAEGRPEPNRPMFTTTAVGLLLTFPLLDVRSDAIRLVWNAGPDGPAEPSLEDFQEVLMKHTRLQIKLKDVLWQSVFAVNERQAESYVHLGGRVLLAGDAAHVHTPAGGQGMNTGLQDATNLAWKVALAAAGDLSRPAELLQTYQEERHPVGANVLKFSGTLLRTNAVRHPLLRFLRRIGLGVLTRIPAVRQAFVSNLVEDSVTYTSSSLAKPATAAAGPPGVAGTAFPDVSILLNGAVRSATDLLRGGDSSVACFGTLVLLVEPGQSADNSAGRAAAADGRQPGSCSSSDETAADGPNGAASKGGASAAWPSTWGHWPLHVVHVARGGQGSSAGSAGGTTGHGQTAAGGPVAVDAWGLLSQHVGGCDGVLVRPDGIIAAAGGPEDVAAWLAAHCT